MDPQIELIGASPGMAEVREKIERLLPRQSGARRLAPVLLQGETGTGKGLIARLIHRAGPRRGGPFVDVNCAAIPENLLEAEMFGFERGAFTDARQAKPGLFQVAHGGTIFLDEIGLLPEALQAKLLKVIEERAVRRLGATRSEDVDVWIVTATNEDLAAAIHARRFRADLYHRLAVVTLPLPPLRERGEDILLLADHFLARACADYGLSRRMLTPEARQALLGYPWPGNIRELSNVIERVALLWDAPVVTAEMLGLQAVAPAVPPAQPRALRARAAGAALEGDEREGLLAALRETDWNVSRAAARLGISRNTIRYRIEKHHIRRGVDDEAAPPPLEEPMLPPPPFRVERVDIPVPPVVRWERRRITFLRAAVVPPAEAAYPPDLSRVFEVLVDKAQSFGGQIEELSQAAIVAVFGLEPSEDAPRRAANAAMAIVKGVERGRRAEGSAAGRLKIAVHVAEVLVGRVNGSTQIDHETKQGLWPTLDDLIARAAADTIVVSAATVPFLERHFDLVASGEPPVKLYRLSGRERPGLGAGASTAKFVGRRHELELVRGRFESAVRGHGQVVGIVGEAGIGKSRLLFEFKRGLADDAATWLEGHCLSYASAIAYLPVLELIRTTCGIQDTDSPTTVAEKIRGALADFAMGPMEGAPYLLYLLGIKDETDWVAELGPETIRAGIFETLRQMSLMGSRQRPRILVVEDLHWIDRTSEEYFDSLIEVLGGARILMIVTYRPGYRPRWMDKSYATQVSLQPLLPADSVDVVRPMLGGDPAAESVIELIVAKGEGNPFFLEELARTVREQGASSAAAAVPDTIQEVLLARIDRLSAEEKGVLQAAAVVGKDVPFGILRSIADRPDDLLRQTLVSLRAAEFLYETSVGAEPQYTFKHTLTQEVAYGSLLDERRVALHGQIVEAIERTHAERLPEHVEQLARHSFRGEQWGKAATYLRRAGAVALARSAHREAAAHFEQALAALERLPRSPQALGQAIDVRFDLRNSLHPLAEFGRILDYLREAERLATALNDRRRLGRAAAYMTQYFWWVGQPDRGVESGQRALQIAVDIGDFPLQVIANFYLGMVYHSLGDYPRAMDVLWKGVESLTGDLVHERFGLPGLPSVFFRIWLIQCQAERGDFARAGLLGDEALGIARATDHPFSFIEVYFGFGFLYLRKGDLQQAIPMLEQGLNLCRTWNIPIWVPRIASSLGAAYALSGRVAEAEPLLEEAVERAASMRAAFGHSLQVAWLGEACFLAGRVEDARELADRALALARTHSERGHEAWALRLLGEIASSGGLAAVEEAHAYYGSALALASELGMRPLLAHCHLGSGRLYGRTGHQADARRHLTSALALFSELEMRSWAEATTSALERLA